jgi:hypothetical protein
MSAHAASGTAARIERRRSARLSVRWAIIVSDEAGGFQEQTRTSSLNTHGVLVALAARVTLGGRLIIRNPENWAERGGRVTRLGRRYAGRSEVGIEFTEPAPNFWLITNGSQRVQVQVD